MRNYFIENKNYVTVNNCSIIYIMQANIFARLTFVGGHVHEHIYIHSSRDKFYDLK